MFFQISTRCHLLFGAGVVIVTLFVNRHSIRHRIKWFLLDEEAKELLAENHRCAQQIQPRVNERLKKIYSEILERENESTADAVKPRL